MSWVRHALNELARGNAVDVRPGGGSMRGRIEDGELVRLVPVEGRDVVVDQIVLVRWGSNYLLHLVKEARDDDLLIGNARGRINGWVKRSAVLALCVGK